MKVFDLEKLTSSYWQVNLQVVQPLTARQLSGQKLGLDGEHQYLNAGLAVSLASTWLQQVGKLEVPSLTQTVNCSALFTS